MIKIYVMNTCPDCTDVKVAAKDDPRFEVVEISEHISKLKEFLRLRDTHPAFDTAKANGYAGVPAFLLPDGRMVFTPEEAGLDITTTHGPSCNIDGTGC